MNSRVIEGASATDNASRQATQLLERTGSAAEGTLGQPDYTGLVHPSPGQPLTCPQAETELQIAQRPPPQRNTI